MSPLYIYAVYLEENRYFIHCDKIERDYTIATDEKIMKRCELLNDYVKKYRPISIDFVDTMKNFAILMNKNALYEQFGEYYLPELSDLYSRQYGLLLDFYVKKYMCEFGIDNVRGGSYSEEILEENDVAVLTRELENSVKIKKNLDFLDNIEEKIDALEKNTLISDKKDYVESLLNKFYAAKEKYEDIMFFKVNDVKTRFGENLLKEMQWLKMIVINAINDANNHTSESKRKNLNPLNDEANKNKHERYKKLILCLKHITDLYKKYHGEIECEDTVYLYHPDFLFDKYIYHLSSDGEENRRTKELEYMALCLFDDYESMYYSIVNRLDELEFDIKTFSSDFEKEATAILWNFAQFTPH